MWWRDAGIGADIGAEHERTWCVTLWWMGMYMKKVWRRCGLHVVPQAKSLVHTQNGDWHIGRILAYLDFPGRKVASVIG